jgi:SNF2 family DNA or RNA helicase
MKIKPLFKHQKQSVKFLGMKPKVFDMSDPGTGKTRVEIEDVAFKAKLRNPGAVLILAPKSLLQSAWGDDFNKFAPNITYSIATATNRLDAFKKDADVFITNHDAVVALSKQPASFWKKFKGGTLIIDESSAFKHRTSIRSKAIAKIAKSFTNVRLMSGTPNSNGICDLWHQVFILDSGQRLGKSFFAFRASVCEPEQTGPMPNMVRWVDKAYAESAVSALISDIVIRHKFEDCTDIPPNHQYPVNFTLSTKHMAAYRKLENDSVLYLKDAEINAVNGASLYTKLLQLASGAVYNTEGAYSLIDSDRYELVLDLTEAAKHSIVFFNWAHQRDELLKQAKKRDLRFALIDGTVTRKGERERIVEAYQRGLYDILFAHPQSAGHGLTLVKGTRTIFASPTPNLEHYQQGLKRIHRIGQEEKTETIMVVAPGTIEEKVYESLMAKNLRMSTLLNYLKKAA